MALKRPEAKTILKDPTWAQANPVIQCNANRYLGMFAYRLLLTPPPSQLSHKTHFTVLAVRDTAKKDVQPFKHHG